MKEIKIYYASVCSLCHKAMDYFDSENIPYTKYELVYNKELDIFEDNQNYKDLKETLQKDVNVVPQFFIGKTHIQGWKTLEPMIKSGEFNKLLNSDE